MRHVLLTLMAAIMLIPFLPGCRGGNAMRMMDRADSLIVSEPTAALKILDDMPSSSRAGGETEARYNMLRTEALYRALDDTILPDSAIAASVSYYTRKDDKANAARARYYHAMLKMQRRSYAAATVDLLVAESYAKDITGGHFLKGLIYRGLGDCFAEFYDMTTAITYQKKSYQEFKSAQSDRYAGYALTDIANRYLDVRNYDSAILNAEKSVHISNQIGDDLLLLSSELVIAQCLEQKNNNREAISIYEQMHSLDSTLFRDVDYLSWGLAYLKNKEVRKAIQCSSHIRKLKRAMNSIEVSIIYNEGRYKECSDLLISTMDILDSLQYTVWTRNDLSVINDYYKIEQEESAKALRAEKNKRNVLIAITVLVVLLALVVYRLIVVSSARKLSDSMLKAQNLRDAILGRESLLNDAGMNIRAMKTQMSELHSDISELTDKNRQISDRLKDTSSCLEQSRNELDNSLRALEEARSSARLVEESNSRIYSELLCEIHKLLLSRFKMLNSLLADKYNLEHDENGNNSEKKTEKIYRLVKSELERFIDNPDITEELERVINSKLDNLIVKLREDFPDFNENFINFYIFTILGFQSATIATLQNTSLATVYSRKSKLKKKLIESKNERSSLYLQFFI